MPKIKNINYNRFIKEGFITVIREAEIKKALENIDKFNRDYKDEGKALLLLLYYTGARPREVLEIKAKDIYNTATHIIIKVIGVKKGLPRTIYLPTRKPFVSLIISYVSKLYPDLYLFNHYRNSYNRSYTQKSGEVKVYEEITDKLRYYFKRWFKDVMLEGSVNPYYLRHNRFSALAEAGASMEDIRLMKGGKSLTSVSKYLHLSSKTMKKLGRLLE